MWIYHSLTLPPGPKSLKPQHTKAIVRVMCTSCKAHTPVSAQKVNRAGKDSIRVTFKAGLHKHACKNGASTLQAQLSLDCLPAGGGWKPYCSGKLNVALSSPPPQKQRTLASMLLG